MVDNDEDDANDVSPSATVAPFARRHLQTSMEPCTAAQNKGVRTLLSHARGSVIQRISALFGSAPLLSRRSAESQALKRQARLSGVTWEMLGGAPDQTSLLVSVSVFVKFNKNEKKYRDGNAVYT